MFSPRLLGQIRHPMLVLKSACHEDSQNTPFKIFEVKDNGYHFKNWLLFNFLLTLQKTSLLFNLEYLSQFFINFNDQCQFWNLLVMRTPKQTLIFEFDAALTELFKVEDKAQFPKSHYDIFCHYLKGTTPHQILFRDFPPEDQKYLGKF